MDGVRRLDLFVMFDVLFIDRHSLIVCRFMKLRLDRVLKLDLGNMSIDAATKSTAKVPEFESQEWNAPYTPYSKGWWEVFMR